MNYKTLFRIAYTHLSARPRQTLVSVAGVTLGIAIFVALTGLVEGVNSLTNLAEENTAHIRLYREATFSNRSLLDEHPDFADGVNIVPPPRPQEVVEWIKNSSAMVDLLRQDQRVKTVSPQLGVKVFYNFGASTLNGLLVGAEMEAEDAIFALRTKTIKGNYEDLLHVQNGVAIGRGVAKKLNVTVGDRLQLTTPQGNRVTFRVVAIIQTGVQVLDDTRGYTLLSSVQKMMGLPPSCVNTIHLNLWDKDQAEAVARELAATFHLQSTDFRQANAQFETFNIIRFIITQPTRLGRRR